MQIAITLRLDATIAPRIARLWDTLAAEGIDTDRQNLGYAPHITLAIYPGDTPRELLSRAVAAAATRWQPLSIAVAGLGIFPGPASIIWAAPVVTPALLACHADWHSSVPNLPVHPHYQPGLWVPHITLSGPLRDAAPAVVALTHNWQACSGTADRIDFVQFRPVEMLHSQIIFA